MVIDIYYDVRKKSYVIYEKNNVVSMFNSNYKEEFKPLNDNVSPISEQQHYYSNF